MRKACGTYLENGLHLGQFGPGMLAREHFDYQTTHAPDICRARVRFLLYDLGCHPEHRPLQRRSVHALSRQEI